MKIAAAQIACALGDLDANLRKIRDFSSRAKEAAASSSFFRKWPIPATRCRDSEMRDALERRSRARARRKSRRTYSIAIVCGVSERGGEAIYNSQVFIDANGEIVAHIESPHLFTPAPLEERQMLFAGQ